jgi:hypothetical protein
LTKAAAEIVIFALTSAQQKRQMVYYGTLILRGRNFSIPGNAGNNAWNSEERDLAWMQEYAGCVLQYVQLAGKWLNIIK